MTGPARRSRRRKKKYSLSCTEAEWERIKSRARERNLSAGTYAVGRALSARLKAGGSLTPTHSLVLSADEQHELLDRVRRLAELVEARDAGGETLLERIHKGVAFVVDTRMRDMLRAGHADDMEAIAGDLFGDSGRERVRAWIARRTASASPPP